MIVKQIQGKGILAKLLEQCVRILILKECKKINNLKINIISSSANIIKGEIQKINISAENINYKDLLFDKFELEGDNIKIIIKLTNKELYFKNNPIIKFKISLSQKSVKAILFSNSWDWISEVISNEILNKEKLEDIEIINDELLIKATKNEEQKLNIKTEKGKIYLRNKNNKKSIQIPIEDKIFIENIYTEDNLINIIANSPISI
tara:strand:- start:367 stop:984 length:618 start_codon:yes stop_codon:yes gene_type:complete